MAFVLVGCGSEDIVPETGQEATGKAHFTATIDVEGCTINPWLETNGADISAD